MHRVCLLQFGVRRAWSALYSTVSRPFPKPKGKGKASGKIAIKVINHYGDEVPKVYTVD